MKFLLTSSGLRNDAIFKALSDLVQKPTSKTAFLFVLTAANIESGDKEWLITDLVNIQKHGFKSVDVVDIAGISKDNWLARMKEADVICFSGGSEQYLAQILEEVNFKDLIPDLFNDKVYMGISAGSMVAGMFLPKDVDTILYPEESYMGKWEQSLGLTNICFLPHLNSKWFTHVRKELLESIKDKLTSTTYALDDETALTIVDDKINIIGNGDYWVFEK